MSVRRIGAIVIIYLVATGGWAILGTTTLFRSQQFTDLLGNNVKQLWGTPLAQQAPSFLAKVKDGDTGEFVMPTKNDLTVRIDLDYRQKGLIWYPTYAVHFKGVYTITNTGTVARDYGFHFTFPSKTATYDEFEFRLGEEKLEVPVNIAAGIDKVVALAPGESRTLSVGYRTRGLKSWRYQIDPQVGRVQNLSLVMHTDFADLDYPDGSYSPTSPAKIETGGAVVEWQASDLITQQDIGIIVPEKLNPGPLAGRITFFAPVCLLFFFILVATISIIRRVDIHPMHYLFVAAGFAAFHVLLAYLVDHIDIHLAFILSATVSVTLVTSYMSAALKGGFPRKVAIAGQFFFLVLFSYSFFLKGMTGLAIALGSVVTLAVLMRVTAGLDWNEVFSRSKNSEKESA
jgi:hypothetical protein